MTADTERHSVVDHSGRPPAKRGLHIVLVSYACDPSKGTEPGLGWGWAEALARRGHTLELMTRPAGDNLRNITRRIQSLGSVGRRIRLHVIPVSVPSRWIGLMPGMVRDKISDFLQYQRWQHSALEYARRQGFAKADLVHHVSFGALLGGCALHRLGPPLVFGPVGGGQTAPHSHRCYVGDGYRGELLRKLVWVRGMSHRSSCKATLRRAAVVLTTNRDTMRLACRLGSADARLMLADGIPDQLVRHSSKHEPERRVHPPTVLWVGGLSPHKAPALALRAFALLLAEIPDARLAVLGDGPLRADLERLAAQLDIAQSVCFQGRLPWEQALKAYDTADVMLFTSLRDSSGAQTLEAWARGLPVVHLDHQGIGDFSAPGGSIPVSLGDPADLPGRLARALGNVLTDHEARQRMAAAGVLWARQHTWTAKALLAEQLYDTIRNDLHQSSVGEASQ